MERQNYGDSRKNSGWQRLAGREGLAGKTQRIFRAVKLFCLTECSLLLQTHVSKPIECRAQEWFTTYPTDSEWLWCVSVDSSIATHFPFWCGMLTVGAVRSVCEKSLHCLLSFAINLQLPWKVKFTFLKLAWTTGVCLVSDIRALGAEGVEGLFRSFRFYWRHGFLLSLPLSLLVL